VAVDLISDEVVDGYHLGRDAGYADLFEDGRQPLAESLERLVGLPYVDDPPVAVGRWPGDVTW
jgi:hypothetical protein